MPPIPIPKPLVAVIPPRKHLPVVFLIGLFAVACVAIFANSNKSGSAAPGCGLAQTAFCDTFDAPAGIGNRSGDLNGTIWGVSRTTGNMSIGQLNNAWSRTQLVGCNGTTQVQPPNDVIICGGRLRQASNDNHTVTTVAMYPKQPFDFAGRTGVVTFDVTNDTQGTHAAWPEFWLTDLPIPAPFTHGGNWVANPKDGFGLRFAANAEVGQIGGCPNGNNLSQRRWTVSTAVVIRNYVMDDTDGYGTRTSMNVQATDCVIASSGPNGGLNHVELRIAQNSIEVWATDAGQTAPLRKIAVVNNPNLSLSRGLIWIEDTHYNASKGSCPGGLANCQTEHTFTWDNVGFDGPFTYRDLAFDALDNTTVNGDGTINLGKSAGPNLTTTWNVTGMPPAPQAAAVRVLFNFFHYNAPSTINVSVNGHAHPTAWPYPEQLGYTWRTFAVSIPITDLVAGTNVVTIGGNQAMVVSNVGIVLVNTGGAGGTPVPTATAQVATSTATATTVAVATNTPVPGGGGTCTVIAKLNGMDTTYTRPMSECQNQ